MNQKESAVELKTKNVREVEDVISRAIKKVNGRKENDLCKYIPGDSGGYMHHFTLKKLKNRRPQELSSLIEKFIINSERPSSLPPKQRAPRGSRKRKDLSTFTRAQLEKMISFARQVGDTEMVAILSPKRSLPACKKELIASIKKGHVEPELWHAYVEACSLSSDSTQSK